MYPTYSKAGQLRSLKADSDPGMGGLSSSSTSVENEPMKCEIKHLQQHWNEKDEQYVLEPKETEVQKPVQNNWWRLFAFCIVKDFEDGNAYETTRLYVNAVPLRMLLKDVIGNYPDVPIHVDYVRIESPYHPLFYYRQELETEGLRRFKYDAESKAQLKVLLNWIRTYFAKHISAYENCISGLKAISFESLWTLFPPNKIVYTKMNDKKSALRVHSCWYTDAVTPFFYVTADLIDFDGNTLGMRRTSVGTGKYVGTRQLKELPIIPFNLLDDGKAVRAELIERGRKFESYIGQHFVQYNGIGIKKIGGGLKRYNVNGRIMIDCATYQRIETNDVIEVIKLGNSESSENSILEPAVYGIDCVCETRKTWDKLSDENALIASATVRGFDFASKQFLEFSIDAVSPIEWNTRCFDELVLDPTTKKTVQAIVSMHSSNEESFDDIVKGKGQGLVCALHGPPGVGKTLTAKCVAEYLKRPLYIVSSGELGLASEPLESKLKWIMDLVSTWKAVLLIDEADIFLEQRSLHDIQRNAMVSVFLRALEYYSGILFLTTSRVTTFDEAFKSRIHVPIRYTDLSMKSREKVWRNLCRRVPAAINVDDAGFKELAEHSFNGRQIKNVIKAAESLAAFDGVKIDLEQLRQVIKIQHAFERDLTTVGGVDYSAPGESRRRSEKFNMFT
ncbi:P-loop containing nucleoside triphosphate hydrolase protein [Daldinia bambusicola]|nr:P-loop containing nucleoside triphosphate hydrolase protein [Daldinia bambusicola]